MNCPLFENTAHCDNDECLTLCCMSVSRGMALAMAKNKKTQKQIAAEIDVVNAQIKSNCAKCKQ